LSERTSTSLNTGASYSQMAATRRSLESVHHWVATGTNYYLEVHK